MEYTIGQKVKIIANRTEHEFEIGEVVKVKELDSDGSIWSCENKYDWWCVNENDVEPYDEEEDGWVYCNSCGGSGQGVTDSHRCTTCNGLGDIKTQLP